MKRFFNQELFCYIFLTFISILVCFKTFHYGFIYDDRLLVTVFLEASLYNKIDAMRQYAKFHFYPVYFLTHTIDQILTNIFFNLENYLDEKRIIIPRITNYIIHLLNSFILLQLLKKIFNSKKNIVILLGVTLFLIHPAVSQPLFNVTTRNELLYIFFSLLTFSSSFIFFETKNLKTLLKINCLFLFALCSKLFAIIYIGLIPCFFILKFSCEKKIQNYKNQLLFLTGSLLVTFFFYYFIRFLNTSSYELVIDTNILNNFFSSLHFYIRSLFFPIEHFYTNVNFLNTNAQAGQFIFLILLLLFLYSIYELVMKKKYLLFFYFFWIGSSLSLPIYFGILIPESFPLTSELNERYAYGSIVTVSYIVTAIMMRLTKYKNIFVYSKITLAFVIICSVFFLNERSKVYKNDYLFWYSATYNHEDHLFNHMVPAMIKLGKRDYDRTIFHAYQNLSLYPESIMNALLIYNTYLSMGNYINAEKFYKKMYLEKFGDHPMVQVLRTDNLMQNKKFKESVPLLKNVIKFYDNNNWKDTIEIHRHDTTIRNFSKDDIYFKLGVCYANLNKKKEAFENFKKAYTYNYRHTTAKYNAGILAKEFGQNELAIELIKQAVNQNPNFRKIMDNTIKNQ